jgi:excisionase family DNA binding protein
VKNDSQSSANGVGPEPSFPSSDAATITPATAALLYLRAEQVIHVLPVSRRTLSNWQARRLIKFYRIGKTVLFKRADIEAAVEKFAIAAIGEPKIRQQRAKTVETGTIINEPVTPRKRRAGRIVAPASGPES